MDLHSSHQNGVNVVTVNESRIDAAVAIKFKDAMRVLTETGPDRVVLDLAQVEFIDSSGLGAIVAAMKQLGEGRHLELAALSPNVEKVFRLTRMNTVFSIHRAVSDAYLKKSVG